MADWIGELRRGNSDSAWDLFIADYRRVIFAAIHHYARDPDDVMDVFARVCEALREDDLRRLRTYLAQPDNRASLSTWLVAVVHNLAIDWFRHRDGRPRHPVTTSSLTPLQQRIFEHIYVDRQHHVAAYEMTRASAPELTFGEFLVASREMRHALMTARHDHLLRASDARSDLPAVHRPPTGETAERRAVLDEAVRSLDTEERRAVDLYVIDERPAATVAVMLGLPNAKAVYNRVYRALGVLRARLDKLGIRRGDL